MLIPILTGAPCAKAIPEGKLEANKPAPPAPITLRRILSMKVSYINN
jgi:hypothetical protein